MMVEEGIGGDLARSQTTPARDSSIYQTDRQEKGGREGERRGQVCIDQFNPPSQHESRGS